MILIYPKKTKKDQKAEGTLKHLEVNPEEAQNKCGKRP